jgi:hypothetical protein
MAKVEFGPLVSSVKGAVGGVTFRGAGNRASVCIKTIPGASRTTAQSQNAAAMAAAFQAWGALNRAERLSWYWYGVSLGENRRGRISDSLLAQSIFVRWASGLALVRIVPPILWPLYPLIDPPSVGALFVWDDAPSSAGSAFVFVDELEPIGAAVWLTPQRPSTGRPRGRRVLVWNTGTDGGTFVPSIIGPPYAWKLQVGAAAWDKFAQYPTGTLFSAESLTVREDGAVFRQILGDVEKTTS